MDLGYKIADYYNEKGIKVNYDPYNSKYKTWFGTHIPVEFNLERENTGVYWKDTKEIFLPHAGKVDKIAKILLHEIGHANTSTGSHILTDATMIPAILLATKITEKAIYDGTDLISAGMLFICTTLSFRYSISELLAEGYRYSKMIFRKR